MPLTLVAGARHARRSRRGSNRTGRDARHSGYRGRRRQRNTGVSLGPGGRGRRWTSRPTDRRWSLQRRLRRAQHLGGARRALRATSTAHDEDVVVDLSGVTAIDLTALKVLAFATREASREGHHLTLRGCGPSVRRMLHLSRLIRVVEVERAAPSAPERRACRTSHTRDRLPRGRSRSYPRYPWTAREGPPLGDAHVRRPLHRRRVERAVPHATWPRGRPACRSPSTCRPRPATTRTARCRAARSARSACRSRTSARCAGSSTDIPLTEMNTSMTINATAMWLLAMYQVVAEEQNPDSSPEEVAAQLAGTTQNDIIKEYLSRGTYVFPPEHSLRLISDMIAYTVHQIPKWNPINICSYHLQEAGATPTQELAYALCTAIAVLDQVKASGQVSEDDFEKVVGRISFFVNAGVRFVEETCKMRAFVELWDQITRERYGVEDPKMRRFRYGVQVNSLGLTEAQPENNVQRIVLEMLGVTLSQERPRPRRAAARRGTRRSACPRPWDQQWSLRLQQVLAFESDLLEYDDIFDGSTRDRGQGGRARRGRPGRDRPGAGDGRRDRRRRVRLHEAGAGLRPRRPPGPDRVRRGEDRRRQRLRDHRAVAADRRPRRRDHGRRPGGRAVRPRLASRAWKAAARRGRGRRGAGAGWPPTPRPTPT